MAPARSTRRNQHEQSVSLRSGQDASPTADGPGGDLFLEPMMGTPLNVYIEKEVEDRDTLVELVTVGHPLVTCRADWFTCLWTVDDVLLKPISGRNTAAHHRQDIVARHIFLVSIGPYHVHNN
jgi:hypothetical protein